MKIKKIITINWANLENREFILDDLVFLTGQTGVGKSTLLDAIQTVLTGAIDKVVNYNAGQDESERKTKGKEFRSLGGYILGEDRELYSRPSGATGTIVLTFVSTEKETNKIFNAIVNVKCSMEEMGKRRKAVVDENNFFIVKNGEIYIEDLLDDEKVLLGNDLFNKIEKNPQFNKEDIHLENRKSHYLGLLYGQLWGVDRVPPERAKKAAKALARFIYARPVENLNNFVRDEFLEDKNMNNEITKLSDALTTLKEIRNQSDIVQYGISELEKFTISIDTILNIWKNNSRSHLLHSAYQLNKANQEKHEFNSKVKDDDEKIVKFSKKVDMFKKKIQNIDKALVPLISKRDNSEAFQNIERLNKEIETHISYLGDIKINLIKVSNQISTNVRDDIFKITQSKFNLSNIGDFDLLYEKIDIFSKLNLSQMLPITKPISKQISEDNFNEPYNIIFPLLIEIEGLLKIIVDNIHNSKDLDDFLNEFSILKQQETDSTKTVQELEEKISNLENNQTVCPDFIQSQYNTLKELKPDIPMSMLYQHVDIKDNEQNWAYSIEGFLKNNRFAIIVPIGYELNVINLVKKEGLNYLKIIQSTKMLEDIQKTGYTTNSNSIINKLIIDNEIAKAYLIKNYRNVLCYENESELKLAERGILKDYKAVNGGLIFFCKAKELFFGENARVQMLLKSKNELKKEQHILSDTTTRLSDYRIINKIFSYNIPSLKFEAEKLFIGFDDNYSKYLNNKNLLLALNTTDFQKLNQQIDDLNNTKEDIDEKRIEISTLLSNLNSNKKNRNSDLGFIESKINKANEQYETKEEEFIKIMTLVHPAFKIADLNIKSNLLDTEPDDLRLAISDEWNTFINIYIKSEIFKHKEIYYEENIEITEIKSTYQGFQELFTENKKTTAELSRLKGSLQIKYQKEIKEGEEKVKEVFVEGFCVTMYRNIRNCKQEIDKFSSMLSKHRFENDQFIMVTLDSDPEYEEYKKLFTAVAENDNLFEIANNEELENTKNDLLEKFLDLGQNRNQLVRIADYRNYAKYDIIQKDDQREVSLSKSGKNSGGQGETSYYIIRSINLHAALNPILKKGFTLETVLIDESFVKTNDERAKEIINYLNKTLGFQVIMALPTKGANELIRMNCSNYNIAKLPVDKKGELDYVAWARYMNNNAEAINRRIEAEQPTLFDEATKEGTNEYERLRSI